MVKLSMKGNNMNNEKKYTLAELTTCSFDPTHILVIKKAFVKGDQKFCSKNCKATYISDMELSRSW